MQVDMYRKDTLYPGKTIRGPRGDYTVISPITWKGNVAHGHDSAGTPCIIKAYPEDERWGEHDCFLYESTVQRILMAAPRAHPNVMSACDVIDGAEQAIVMPYIPGKTLDDYVRHDGTLTPLELLSVIPGICDGLDYLHGKGIVHRDITLKNVFLEDLTSSTARSAYPLLGFVRPKLFDFDAAYHEMLEGNEERGVTFGAPLYLAPESIRETPAPGVDIYAVGTGMYLLLTGDFPFRGETLEKIMLAKMLNAPHAPHGRSKRVCKELSRVVLKALAVEPSRRYATASELRDDFNDVVFSHYR